SRFEPIRTEGDGADLHGTDRPAVEVTVETTDKTKHVLKFSDRTGGGPRFDRPTYVRVGDGLVWRLGPGVVAPLHQPARYYLQRRLFPSARVPREEGSSTRVARLTAKKLEVEQTEVEFAPAATKDDKDKGKDSKDKADRRLERKQHSWRFVLESKHRA